MKLNWLESPAHTPVGVSFGVPWKRGELEKNTTFQLKGSNDIEVESWPMAFWPDGSVKWTGHSAVITDPKEESFKLTPLSHETEKSSIIKIEEENSFIKIQSHSLECVIEKQGETVIHSIKKDGIPLTQSGKLLALFEYRNEEKKQVQYETFTSIVETVEVEQVNSVRAVVKVTGMHKCENTNSEKLPFVLRLYFHQSLDTIKMVHTFIYDGNPNVDFIKGLGITFKTSLKGKPWNRHIRFGGDQAVYTEPAQLLLTRRYPDGKGYYPEQLEGKKIVFDEVEDQDLIEHVSDHAVWNDFKLIQDSADHFKMSKRTDRNHAWVDMTHGSRSLGLAYLGGEQGGVAFGLKNFWQKHPSTLEIAGLNEEESDFTLWFWSSETEAMDLRHYDDDTHVLSSYEGFDEWRATPTGIANTNECYLQLFSNSPSNQELTNLAIQWQQTTLLTCEPEYYYETKVFGKWSLPDRNNPLKAQLEQHLDDSFTFYQSEIEQRKWYGFWDYGDVMHTYDPHRHQWRYDVGGFAWQNTELVPNMWLWYSFLRTGRADVFKLAEEMTRHTSEVDQYHLGEYKGLGSRHNVKHWGCGCKEARISMAGLHKFYYFLTTDERTLDVISDVKDADFALLNLDPMREFYDKDESFPTHARIGPDWSAFVSNWLSEWERTENKTYQQKIIKGIEALKKMPRKLLSGPTLGYDPESGELLAFNDGSASYHMVISFGAPQVWMELADVLEDDEWKNMIAEFGEFYTFSDEEKRERTNGELSNQVFHWPMFSSGMVAYAAFVKSDPKLAEIAWKYLLDESITGMSFPLDKKQQKVQAWKEIEEIPWISTNVISQWCLNTIVALELIGDELS
ncbi:hypothetical protein [Alkalihalobacillus trypoxylicola]|uniref:Tat pathway signal sequence domain protein n=1 Tax=Alkalihalobacillus trypoxylicola TaxID=519424 RepID=A0A162CTC3_9BACI|nr:hypothetical protein [Alkalihalobacillus trypoxylicola]KYG26569.1 hypothetical protein AZF04_12210 [Alkalihalobacillus trypoxylicola]